MKFRVKNTNETLPVVQDSLICGLRPDGNEVEFSVNDVELIPDDWSSFRREVAKDILANVAGQLVHDPTTNAIDEFDPEFYAKVAVECSFHLNTGWIPLKYEGQDVEINFAPRRRQRQWMGYQP